MYSNWNRCSGTKNSKILKYSNYKFENRTEKQPFTAENLKYICIRKKKLKKIQFSSRQHGAFLPVFGRDQWDAKWNSIRSRGAGDDVWCRWTVSSGAWDPSCWHLCSSWRTKSWICARDRPPPRTRAILSIFGTTLARSNNATRTVGRPTRSARI